HLGAPVLGCGAVSDESRPYHFFDDFGDRGLGMADLPGNFCYTQGPLVVEHKEDRKPFGGKVQIVEAINLGRIVGHLGGEHPQSASKSHFSGSVKKVHNQIHNWLCKDKWK